MPEKIILEEQGLRDGLQTLTRVFSTEQKLAWARQLAASGLRRIQVASFVHPKLVPQMADAEAIFAGLPSDSSVVYSALVLNVRGVERAIAAGVKHLAISLSASDTHSQRNARMTLKEAKQAFQEMTHLAKAHGIAVRGGIQCAFGCRFEGHIEASIVLQLVEHHLALGVDELALADSTGMANPRSLKALMTEVLRLAGSVPVALHLHNTENKGYANVYAAVEAGVRQFDTAFGGLGGCPFIRNASGNIATEDTVHMLHQMGCETGIDPRAVAQVSLGMEALLEQPLPGMLYKLLQNQDICLI